MTNKLTNFSEVFYCKIPKKSTLQFSTCYMGTDRQSDADMYMFTACESTKMNAESRT